MKEVVNKAYKFRIYPNDTQKVFVAKHFGCVRFVYNHLLATRSNAYKKDGVSMSGFDCQNLIPELKKQDGYAWLKEVNSQSLQGAALNLEKAYKCFFDRSLKAAYPSFKKKGSYESFCVPQHFTVDAKRNLAKSQRRLSRKKKGSKNRSKERMIVARLHEKVSNQRSNFIHNQSKRLVNENQVIYLETLNVNGMIKNRHLSKAISDCGWSEFVRQLKYKADWSDSTVVQIGQWEPSSKLCSTIGCDYKYEALKLSERNWTCPQCNTIHDRDVNAAKNIKQIGLEAPELTPVKKMTSVFSIKKTQVDSAYPQGADHKQESHVSV